MSYPKDELAERRGWAPDSRPKWWEPTRRSRGIFSVDENGFLTFEEGVILGPDGRPVRRDDDE